MKDLSKYWDSAIHEATKIKTTYKNRRE